MEDAKVPRRSIRAILPNPPEREKGEEVTGAARENNIYRFSERWRRIGGEAAERRSAREEELDN